MKFGWRLIGFPWKQVTGVLRLGAKKDPSTIIARIGGRPGMGDAILTRHGGDDLLKGILKLSCEPNEISDGGAEGTGVARVGIGLPLSTTTLGKMGAPLTEKSRRPVSTGSSSETEVEAWAGPILPVTVGWGFPTVTTVVRVLLGEWGAWGLRKGSRVLHKGRPTR